MEEEDVDMKDADEMRDDLDGETEAPPPAQDVWVTVDSLPLVVI